MEPDQPVNDEGQPIPGPAPQRPGRRVPAEEDALLQRLYEEGRTYREIAEHLGLSPSAASVRATRLRKQGLLDRRITARHLTEELAERLNTLRAQGRTAVEIGKALGMTPQLVEYHLRQLRKAGGDQQGQGSGGEPRGKFSPIWVTARALEWPLTVRQLAAALYTDDDAGRESARSNLRHWANQGRVVRRARGLYDLAPPS